MLERNVEGEILPWVRARGIGFLAYSPLARGLLAGRVGTGSLPLSDGRRTQPLFQPVNSRRVNATLESVLGPIAHAHGVSVAAIALAWVVARPGVTAAIVGAQDLRQIEAASVAVEVDLAPEVHAEIDERFRALALDRSAGLSLAARVTQRLRRIGHGLRRVRERIHRRR